MNTPTLNSSVPITSALTFPSCEVRTLRARRSILSWCVLYKIVEASQASEVPKILETSHSLYCSELRDKNRSVLSCRPWLVSEAFARVWKYVGKYFPQEQSGRKECCFSCVRTQNATSFWTPQGVICLFIADKDASTFWIMIKRTLRQHNYRRPKKNRRSVNESQIMEGGGGGRREGEGEG